MAVDINNVKQKLSQLSKIDVQELADFLALIENAASWVDARLIASDASKAELLAAAKANYDISLTKSGISGVTSFKAGDVSITRKSGEEFSGAKALFESILNDCSDILSDSAFDFRCV
ncbi:MAG: hypothetical protein IJT65_05065 [Eubacterium sp.]|nr:hypothetical protein [Eubacterium sp.]